jgi:MYXO-CTERM domain-containing protein
VGGGRPTFSLAALALVALLAATRRRVSRPRG